MWKRFSLLFFLAASCAPATPFAELNALMDRKEEIDAAVRHKTDSLRLLFERAADDSRRWECAEALYSEYRHLNLDSCARYTDFMIRHAGADSSRILRSQAAQVRTMVRAERLDEAEALFSQMVLPPDAAPQDCEAYFYCADRLTNYILPRDRADLPSRIEVLAQDYLARDSTAQKAKFLKIKALRYSGLRRQAIDYALSLRPEDITDVYDLSSYYMALSSLYWEVKEPRKSMEYAAMSACVDLSAGMKDYFSLYMLGEGLFTIGDRREAARYMNRAVQDALEYNYPVGVRRSAQASVMMNDAIQIMDRNWRIMLSTAIVIVSLFLAIALLLLLYSRRMLKQVRRINSMYKASQQSLHNVSTIKDKMLGEYMELSSEYIYKVDENRSRYRKTLKQKGPEALMAVFREPNFADGEFPHYWNNFDKIFLSIFPEFVSKVNRLMPPENAFITDSPGSLTTELRILALIRLGITESKRISVILHVSKGTVYTYRSIMRQASLDPERFEENISRITDV